MRRLLLMVTMVVAVLVCASAALAAPVVPAVSTDAASSVAPDSATLNGTVNPEGAAGSTTYHFEWGVDTSYGNPTDETEAYPGDGSTNGSQDVTASYALCCLIANTTYHYRLVATNSEITVRGDDESFTTPAIAPTVDAAAGFGSAITSTGATAHATLNAQGSDTTYHFNYGATSAYGSVTPDATTGVTSGDQDVTADLAGLVPGTTYHFQMVADNGTGGPQSTADYTLRTASAPAAVSNVLARSATINGIVNPTGQPATYHVEYGLDTTYGTATAELSAGTDVADVPVAVALSHLTPNTVYHARLVTTINGQTTTGDDQTFTTKLAPVATLTAAGIDGGIATLSGTLDVHGVPGATYAFAIQSTTSIYAIATDPVAAPANGPAAVTATVAGLPPGQTYEVRLTIASDSAVVSSAAQTITTASAPPYVPHVAEPEDPTAYLRCPPTCPFPPPATVPPGTLRSSLPLTVAVRGSTATLKITLPTAGSITVTGQGLTSARATVTKAGAKPIKVTLTAAAKKKLARAKSSKLMIKATVRFTPKSGTPTTTTKTIAFKRGSTR